MRGARRASLATLPILASLLLSCGGADPSAIGDGPTGGDPDAGDQERTDEEPDDEVGLPGVGADEGDGGAAGGGAVSSDSRELTIATADAAERTGVAADAIMLVELSMVTWPDGALGCPEPETMYTQALVDGYRIVLDAEGTSLVYHGAIGSDPFLCEDPQEPVDPAN